MIPRSTGKCLHYLVPSINRFFLDVRLDVEPVEILRGPAGHWGKQRAGSRQSR